MGIKRCPYCRALISDRDQYCKNCGTQLLFPEDEAIEEEIPGDRIIEDNRERDEVESQTSDDLAEEFGKENEEEFKTDEEAGEAEDEEIILVEKEEAAAGPGPISPESTGFSEDVEKLPFPGDESRETAEKGKSLSGLTEDYLVEKIKKEVLSEEQPESEEAEEGGPGMITRIVEDLRPKERQEAPEKTPPETRPGLVTRMVEELGMEEKRAATESYEVEAEEEAAAPPTFATAELEKIGPTAELGRREVEDFFKVLEEKEKEHLKERMTTSKKGTEETGEVPSWIKEVKTASTELLTGAEGREEEKKPEDEEAATDEIWLEEETATEPTIGFPEKLTRSGLEPEQAETETASELDLELEEEMEESEERESESGEIFRETTESAEAGPAVSAGGIQAVEGQVLPPLGFKNFVKAKIFDLLFLIMFWLVSIWVAARSMETTIFKLLGMAGSGLLLYLLILTFFYFFLFYFFIGETLGDRLFRESDEEDNS